MPFLEERTLVTELRAQGDILTSATNGRGPKQDLVPLHPVPLQVLQVPRGVQGRPERHQSAADHVRKPRYPDDRALGRPKSGRRYDFAEVLQSRHFRQQVAEDTSAIIVLHLMIEVISTFYSCARASFGNAL
jgi:hypothetical protein